MRTMAVFDAYWEFTAERQPIFFRRLEGVSGVLTTDLVLKLFKFTNANRASDRVSQYLTRNVIYRHDLPSDARNAFFRTILSNSSARSKRGSICRWPSVRARGRILTLHAT